MNQCCLDLDGVLVDFYKGWLLHHGFDPDISNHIKPGNYELMEHFTMDEHQFWKDIGDDFWINLDWMPDGLEILEIVERYFPKENICIVTQSPPSASYTHVGLSGKVAWIAKNLPEYKNNFMIRTGRRFFSHQGSILIDDNPSNINDFDQREGKSILLPRYWNWNYSLDTLTYLNDVLAFWMKKYV
jgi:5'(3')-deoxyribonucleotidase